MAEGDVDGLVEAVGQAQDARERKRRGMAAADYAARHFSREQNCRMICELLESAEQQERPSRVDDEGRRS